MTEMNIYYSLGLVLFLVVLAMFLIRFVNNTVDREFRSLARAVADAEFRRSELRRVDALLAGHLPLPDELPALPPGRGGKRAALPPILLAVGVILLWGSGSARREERLLWYYGALAALCVAGLALCLSLRRRKWERVARLLRFRADLRRMDGDGAGAVSDLRDLLRITPGDDAAWAELSDDLASEGRLPDALEAMREAGRLDTAYDEYKMLRASLAIRLGRLDEAGAAVREWREMDGVRDDDPRLAMYAAALELAEGNSAGARKSLEGILLDEDCAAYEFLDSDQALRGVKDLLPGRE